MYIYFIKNIIALCIFTKNYTDSGATDTVNVLWLVRAGCTGVFKTQNQSNNINDNFKGELKNALNYL